MINPYILQRLKGLLSTINSNYESTIKSTSTGKGAGRANFVQLFLKETMPSNLRISTSGEITDDLGNLTGELDIVIENGALPSWPLIGTDTTRLFIPESVAAVIEVKSDLSNQWDQVIQTHSKVNNIKRDFGGGIYTTNNGTLVFKSNVSVNSDEFPKAVEPNLHSKVPFFVVGYTGWQNIETLKGKLSETQISGILQLDRGFFVSNSDFRLTVEGDARCLYAFIECIQIAAKAISNPNVDTIRYVNH